ncbi:hypothetical protein [Flavobacterium faecale]|nr:hypothetical protein [Flavobacterium faecale]
MISKKNYFTTFTVIASLGSTTFYNVAYAQLSTIDLNLKCQQLPIKKLI